MKTRRSLYSIISLTILLSLAGNTYAATLEGSPEITQTNMPGADMESEFRCTKVTVEQIAGPFGKLQFTYTDGHHTHFLRSLEAKTETPQTFKAEEYIRDSAPYDWYTNTYSCTKAQFANITTLETALTSPASGFSLGGMLTTAIKYFFDFIDFITDWTLDLLGSKLLLIILQQGKFITNDIVTQGWPFIQGLANLGFIFALLYIALATTLRLESVSSSVQRLLPKLLIGALLVNFSLVIGGLFIDLSRLIMAVELNVIGGDQVADGQLIKRLIHTTKIYESTIASIESTAPDWQGQLLTRLKTSLLKIVLSLGLFIIALNLFVRYIMLIILLIFSPIAYLAIALPQTTKYFTQWWGMFLKWVAYGPIVLFFMILITKINSIGLPPEAGTFAHVAQFCVVVALLFAGHAVAKKSAGMGSDAVMGFAAKNPYKTAALAGTVLTGGLGGAALGMFGLAGSRMAGRNVRDFTRDTTSGVVKRARKGDLGGFAKFAVGQERDKDGNIKKGEEGSFGSNLASKITGYSPAMDAKVKAEVDKREAARKSGATYVPGHAATDLTSSKFVARLDDQTIEALTTNGTEIQLQAIGAAIAKDKDGDIGKDKLRKIVTSLDASKSGHSTVISSIVRNKNIISKLDSKGMEHILRNSSADDKKKLFDNMAADKKD